jgi:WD40 repeat protein
VADLGSHGAPVLSVAYSPDGRSVACAAGAGVFVRDAATGQELQCFPGDLHPAAGVAYLPDGRQVVSGAEDGTVRVWDTESGRELTCLRSHEKGVRSVAVSPDGRWIASGSKDGTVRQWNAQAGADLAPLLLDKEGVKEASFSPDGRWAITASGETPEKTVRVWDTREGTLLPALAVHRLCGVRFSPDGEQLAAWLDDGTVRLVDARSGVEQHCLRREEGPAKDASYSADGRLFTWDTRIELWSTQTGTREAIFSGHTGRVHGALLSPDRQLAASWAADTTLRVWDAQTGQERFSGACLAVGPATMHFAVEGRVLVCWGANRMLQVWDVSTGEEVVAFQEEVGNVLPERSDLPLPDGRLAYQCSSDNLVMIVEGPDYYEGISSARRKAHLDGHKGKAYHVGYSPDGKRIVTAAHDRTIRVWDTRSGRERACLAGVLGLVRRISYSADGRLMAVWTGDQTLRIWDMQNGSEPTSLICKEELKALGFAPDGRSVITIAVSSDLRVWDIESATCIRSVRLLPSEETSMPRKGASPWATAIRGLDTVIETAGGRQPLARFPARLHSVPWSATRRVWAARQENYRLCLLRLEGPLSAEEEERAPPAPEKGPAEQWKPPWPEQVERATSVTSNEGLFRSAMDEPPLKEAGVFMLENAITIGRDEGCDILLAITSVSRRHARVVEEEDGYKIEDLGSRNGTFLNGAAVKGKVPLRHGDRIRITEATLVFDEVQGCLRLLKGP